ncbi:hypothetical protein HYALB_00010842 [Hymenoscyphus albidus]|uniref:Repressor of RNA polymerase III transcription MAF1 n=1 Tax=Hymenoscyphus albidus TaxID=595503 RepID=A0A9N9LCG4_9HELO|nr:hypothetical protein HYALB_00010842 [Hymenoscyphus albidus]
MKFLPLADFDDVTRALNFDTPDCHVIGACELYTTKAAGSDKKLYRNIENALESQHKSLVSLSASVSPPLGSGGDLPAIDLSRASPFGSLEQVSSRRTFAYLIATLNASHSDYDFSNVLRPSDFRRERSLKGVIGTIDSTLYNLRPSTGTTLHVPPQTSYTTTASAPAASQAWGPHMWAMVDNEMSLKDCTVYCWAPPDDPFDGDEGSVWSLNYFFFNKERKRIAYIYVRGVPVMSHSPQQRLGMSKRGATGYDSGANKRARYWLGDQAANLTNEDDEEDVDLNSPLQWENGGNDLFDEDEYCDDYDDEADDESDEQKFRSPIREISEDMAMDMEI